jgi:tetratricopeptide (TPR) repeat protein
MEMKIDTLLIETEARMSGNEMNEAFQVGNRLLGYLGIKMPKRVARLHIIRKLFRVKLLTLRKKNSDILALPLMQDSLMLMAIRVLVTVALQGFLRDEPVQAIFSALVATELTLKHGLAPYSAGAIVIYAVVELSSGNYRKAYRLGNLAVQLLDRMQCKEVDCPTMFIWLTVIAHWSDAIRKLSTPLVKAMNTGIEVGDFIYSTYSLAHCFGVSLIVGTNLRRLEEFMQAGYRRIRELSGDTMVFWLLPSIQFVLNLQSHATQWSDLLILTGEVMNEAEYKRQAMESGDRVILPFVSYIKADLARTFGFLEMAQEHFEAATVNEKDWERTFINAHFCFMGAFIYYERYRQTRRRQHLKQARTYKKKIQKIESVGSPNARPFLAYVEAEEESLKPNASIPRLTALFNQAIQVMAAEKWPHQEGQVNERAGFVFAELGLCEEAERYFERAMDLYRYEWGSPPKYEWLKETCAVVLARHTPLHGVLTDRSHVNEIKVHVGNE